MFNRVFEQFTQISKYHVDYNAYLFNSFQQTATLFQQATHKLTKHCYDYSNVKNLHMNWLHEWHSYLTTYKENHVTQHKKHGFSMPKETQEFAEACLTLYQLGIKQIFLPVQKTQDDSSVKYANGKASQISRLSKQKYSTQNKSKKNGLYEISYPEPQKPTGKPQYNLETIRSKKLSGRFKFVIKTDGSFICGKDGHTVLSGKRPVKAAGQICFYQGKIVSIGNDSGHYMPDPEDMLNGVLVAMFKNAGFEETTHHHFITAIWDEAFENWSRMVQNSSVIYQKPSTENEQQPEPEPEKSAKLLG